MTGELWVKDDSANPTHSFKDRVVSVALTAAKRARLHPVRVRFHRQPGELGGRARRPGRRAVDRVHPERPGAGQDHHTAVYGGDLVAMEGSYDDVNRLCSELVETDEFEDTAFVNVNVRPFYAEGSKTLGYEVAEQLGWRIPAQVVMPMAFGRAAHQDRQGVRGVGRDRPGERARGRVEGLRRAVGRVQPDRRRAARRGPTRSPR